MLIAPGDRRTLQEWQRIKHNVQSLSRLEETAFEETNSLNHSKKKAEHRIISKISCKPAQKSELNDGYYYFE